MRLVLQRVTEASVEVAGETIASIEEGVLLFVGIGTGDASVQLDRVAAKVMDLRVFEDAQGKMNRSLRDTSGLVLAVSQFTLYGEVQKGRRPSFTGAAPPEVAEPLFNAFVNALRAEGACVHTGRFGAKMVVRLVNHGPVTLVWEVAERETDR
jgi:D-aminoacyl-tRNA deacylase